MTTYVILIVHWWWLLMVMVEHLVIYTLMMEKLLIPASKCYVDVCYKTAMLLYLQPLIYCIFKILTTIHYCIYLFSTDGCF